MAAPQFDLDSSDPLQALMGEWQQSSLWFWAFLALGSASLFVLHNAPLSALLVAAGAGQVVLKLGHVLIICSNELRKELRASSRVEDRRRDA